LAKRGGTNSIHLAFWTQEEEKRVWEFLDKACNARHKTVGCPSGDGSIGKVWEGQRMEQRMAWGLMGEKKRAPFEKNKKKVLEPGKPLTKP